MNAAPRIQIQDLITEYFLHQDYKHFYVEGPDDCAILEWYLEPAISDAVKVYDIDAIDISEAALLQHGLHSGRKNRLILLARELADLLPQTSKQVLCIVDADFDYLLDRLEESRFLAYTDGTSMDMYAFSESAVDRVLKLGMRDASENAKGILCILYEILKIVFVIRATNEVLCLNLEWLPFKKRCKVQADGTISFDDDKFVTDYLSKNNSLDHKERFSEQKTELLELLEKTASLSTKYIRGHDFLDLLTLYLRQTIKTKAGRRITAGECVSRMLFVGLDRVTMRSFPLFQRVEEFVS